MKTNLTGFEEATTSIRNRFGQELSQEIPATVLHLDASSPYASMRPHQAIVALSALQNTPATVISVATSAGFFNEHAHHWNVPKRTVLKWPLAKNLQYYLPQERISEFAPAFIGGLKDFASLRKARVMSLWRKINPAADENRFSVVDLATHPITEGIKLFELLDQAPQGERIGRIPCPYCSYRKTGKIGKLEFVSHWIKGSFGVKVESYHGKCPMRRIIASSLDTSLAEWIRQTGFALTGRFAYRWFAGRFADFGADAMVVKDHAVASGGLRSIANTIASPNELLVSTRTRFEGSMSDLENMSGDELSSLIKRHPVISNGSEFVC